MPDSSGFGNYDESGCGIAAFYKGEKCNYSCMRIADLPVRKIHHGQHLYADLTLPHGKVLHDYIVEAGK